MSLLNQMLKDLEQRRAESTDSPGLHREIRPLPTAPASSWIKLWLPMFLGMALIAVAAGWYFKENPRSVPEVVAPALMPTPAPVGAAVLPSLIAEAPAKPAEPLPAPAPSKPLGFASAENVIPDRPAVNVPADLRLSEQLSRPGAPPLVHTPAPLPGPAAIQAVVPVPVVQTAMVPAGEVTIDKRNLPPNPREQGERLYRAAVVQMSQGREQDGIAMLRSALRDDPEHLAARQVLIRTSIESRAYEQAQVDLVAGLLVHPKQTAWAMLLARLRVDQGDPAGGLAVLERHEGFAGSAADYQAAMAAMLQRLNRQAEAETRFARAAQSEPENGRWWLGLGMSREALGKTSEAREAFRNALSSPGLSADLKAFAESKVR